MLRSRIAPDLLGAMWSLPPATGAAPYRPLWDNESGVGRGNLSERAAAFTVTLGLRDQSSKARNPEDTTR